MLQTDETPDSTRPRNVWPRLIAFGFVVAFALIVFATCVAAFARSVPARELTIAADQLEPGVPRLLPVTTWGADPGGLTFGALVVALPSGGGTRAFLSRAPGSACQLQWKVVVTNGQARGAFVDNCSDATYAVDGRPLAGNPPRALDQFEVRVRGRELVIPIERVRLGVCVGQSVFGCSTAASAQFQDLPSGPLQGIEGYRR